MKKIIFFAFILLFSEKTYCQTEVDVADITLKVAGLGNEELMYGFAEGDKIIFNMTEKDGKELKEVTISEYPTNIKYQNRAVSKIENKTFNVIKKGIYVFSFYNSNVKGRIINVIIRVPSKLELANFNTKVSWHNVIDTTYKAEDHQYLVKSDTSFIDVVNTIASVHSVLNDNGNKTLVDFTLPQNTKKWAFWIGTSQEAKKAYQKDVETLAQIGSQFASMTLSPLAGLMVNALPALTKTNNGENVKYYFINDNDNALKFKLGVQFLQFKQGDVVSDNCNMPLYNGYVGKKMYVGLVNDNTVRGIDVNVIITAMVVKSQYETRTDKVPVITNAKKPFIED